MAPPTRPRIVIGLDVGKSAHWACVVTREGELLASGPIPNREDAIDGLYAQYPGALVVVDRVRDIGSLALSRAKLAGMPRAYPPGLAAHGASRLFAGDAKTDERDAMVIAKSALGIPDALLAVAGRPPEIGAARSLAAQRDFSTCGTRAARTGSAAYCSNHARNSRRRPASRTRRPSSSWSPSAARGRCPGPRRSPSGRSRAAAGAPKWRRWPNPPNRQAGRARRQSPARTAPFGCSREGYRRTPPRQGRRPPRYPRCSPPTRHAGACSRCPA